MDARGALTGANAGHRCAFFGLSTCVWCRRTRRLLDRLDVSYTFTYVDLLEGPDKEAAVEEVRRFNPRESYPTVVIDGGDRVIVGYLPQELEEALTT